MPIPVVITDLDPVAVNNSPSGAESPVDGDNILRSHAAFIRQLYDGTGSATALQVDLASTTDVAKGAALVGYSSALAYAAGTVGARLRSMVYATDAGVAAAGNYDPVGDTGTDDTVALQAGLDRAGNRTTPPTYTFVHGLGNAQQGTFTLAPGKHYRITAALKVPPGVTFDLNGSVLWQRTASEDCIQLLSMGLGYSFYARYFDCVKNGTLQGRGAGTSTKRGLYAELCNFSRFSDLQISGFEIGRQNTEVQYSQFENITCYANRVGSYNTARATDTTLASIDNTYINCVDAYNTLYGIWNQCQSSSAFVKCEASRNGVVDLLIGGQLTGQLRSFTVTNGGSGYSASATLPVTITDGTGLYAQAYAVTNGSGVVTSVVSVDAGMGYTAPTVTVPGGGVAATVTSTPVTDTAGDWVGASAVSRGMNDYDFKVEHYADDTTTDRPSSGYAIIINNGTIRQERFRKLSVQRQGSGNRQYFRWLFNAGTGNSVDLGGDSSNAPNAISRPGASSTDPSIFRSVAYAGLAVQWGANIGNADFMRYGVNAAGAASYDGEVMQYGLHEEGGMKAIFFAAEYYTRAAYVARGKVYGEAHDSFRALMDGRLQTGAGSAAPTTKVSLATIGVSADRGDTSQTLTVDTDSQTQRWATALTANRTVTLSGTGAYAGAKFRVVRTGLGAFTLDVGGLKTIPNTTAAWVDVEHDGTAWRLTGYGAL